VWPRRYSCNDVAKKQVDLVGFRATLNSAVLIVRGASRVWVLRGRTSWDCEARGHGARERELPPAPAKMAIAGGLASNAPFRLDVATAV
jgi:hypothetical protein